MSRRCALLGTYRAAGAYRTVIARRKPLPNHAHLVLDDRLRRSARAGSESEAAASLGDGSGQCGAGRRPAAAVRAPAVGLGLSRPLRRVLAPTRKSLLGRNNRGSRLPASSWRFVAQGLV